MPTNVPVPSVPLVALWSAFLVALAAPVALAALVALVAVMIQAPKGPRCHYRSLRTMYSAGSLQWLYWQPSTWRCRATGVHGARCRHQHHGNSSPGLSLRPHLPSAALVLVSLLLQADYRL
eukprot:363429-Chlamydomonas_euryale.AAC.18